MKKWRLVVVIILVAIAIISYISSEVYSYYLKTEQQNLEQSINELEAELDDLAVKMNMLSSSESVKQTHPELKYNDNVYYLEENETE